MTLNRTVNWQTEGSGVYILLICTCLLWASGVINKHFILNFYCKKSNIIQWLTCTLGLSSTHSHAAYLERRILTLKSMSNYISAMHSGFIQLFTTPLVTSCTLTWHLLSKPTSDISLPLSIQKMPKMVLISDG